MNKRLVFGALLSGLLGTFHAFSQTTEMPEPHVKTEKKFEYGLDGMVGVSAGERTVGINVGGPSFKVRLCEFKIGVAAMPSLFIRNDKAVPRLAVGPVAEYKHWMLIVPYYGYDESDRQIWTFGIGYKFF
ncbi:hypothetical protein [Flavobacterium selenitireducens]|uniref:hypothetical protein n=1 Tax=Flavobacterium selenitireducens TaxID=2722704 RepID=UPI00168B8D10|nr:hypothetical protein [Flavobacterium selenitireducens]MBD3581938.1 hypothetical protein [Flavobacterium selenitireducens]